MTDLFLKNLLALLVGPPFKLGTKKLEPNLVGPVNWPVGFGNKKLVADLVDQVNNPNQTRS